MHAYVRWVCVYNMFVCVCLCMCDHVCVYGVCLCMHGHVSIYVALCVHVCRVYVCVCIWVINFVLMCMYETYVYDNLSSICVCLWHMCVYVHVWVWHISLRHIHNAHNPVTNINNSQINTHTTQTHTQTHISMVMHTHTTMCICTVICTY